MLAHALMLAADDSHASIDGKSAIIIVIVAIVLIWAGSSGSGRGR